MRHHQATSREIDSMSTFTRRRLLQTSAATAATAFVSQLAAHAAQSPVPPATPNAPAAEAIPGPVIQRKHNIHQSVSRWCYAKMPLDQLCANAAHMGLEGIDLLNIEDWEVPKRYGLKCTTGYGGGGEIKSALNRLENHDAIVAALTKNIPLAAKSGVPNIITFSGLRAGMSDEEGARNCVIGLNRIKPIAEDNGVNIIMELLNSKRDHHDYMCDHTAWGVNVVSQVDSPRIKLLYDIYHMQIMEGDLITTIQANAKWLGHFHTGGVPGRHELDDTQEVNWAGVMRGILATGFTGYVAHEFVPKRDPMTSLAEAVTICDI
jgi:hydroxypyruvate isomerase